jgi:hypothetical protein
LDLVYKIIYWIVIAACLIVPVAIIAAISILALIGMFIWYWMIMIKQILKGFYTVPKDWFSVVLLNMIKPLLNLKNQQK